MTSAAIASELAPVRLRTEHLENPRGIGEPAPRLSWWLPAGCSRQHGFRIRTDNGWDSGQVPSGQSVLVPYRGPALRVGRPVSWQVKVWTDAGESPWSAPATFELGPTDADWWHARWIEPPERAAAPAGRRPAMALSGSFELAAAAEVMWARLHATAHGIYEAVLNGTRVGDLELTPGYTSYATRLQVQSFDVGPLLVGHTNTLTALLSDGWYRGQVGLPRAHDQWGTTVAFLAQLEIELSDGSTLCWGTDASWRAAPSQIRAADLIAGQMTDFGYRSPAAEPVIVVDHGYANLVCSPAPPVRAVAHITPRHVRRVAGGQVFDLGQNINGWVQLDALGPAGSALALTHAETVDAGGDVSTEHLEVDLPFIPGRLAAGQVDHVISDGRRGARFEPRHSTHGFRFVRVAGHPGELRAGDLRGVVVHSDLERVGWFECSDARINRLHGAAVWSFRDNACDIPTDCPTRERAGWTGDWQVFAPAAAFLYDVTGFSIKWLRDLAAEQFPNGCVANLAPSPPFESADGPLGHMNGSAGWGDAAILVPWEIYRASGDRRILAEQWPSMTAWLGYVANAAAAGRHATRIARAAEPATHERYLWDTGFHWGEWLEPGAELKGADAFAAFAAADKADVATAYFARSAAVLAAIAAVLGRASDAARYRALAGRVRDAWQREFVVDGRLVPDTQANHVRALAFELVDDEQRGAVARRLVELIRAADTHLGTGFLATPQLLEVLADSGHLDVAYELLQRDTIPSWLYMIDRGATTMWERWDGIRADGTPHESLNHYSKGAVIGFLHRCVGGIRQLDGHPGYERFAVAPRPGGGISWARVRHDSPRGRIAVSWRTGAAGLELDLTVPPASSAEVSLPDGTRAEAGPGRHHWP